MKKLWQNKKIIIAVSIILVLIAIGSIFLLTINNKEEKNTAYKVSENKKEEDTQEIKVIFNSNGGSLVESITIKKGDKITKPEDPTRKGYKFISWMLNEEEFDFAKEIKENITLIANWQKEEDKSSTSSTSSSGNTSSSTPKYTSTIDKINLKENLTVSIDYKNYTQPINYYFITNLGEVFPSLAGKTNIKLSWDDEDPASYGLDLKIDEWYAAFDKLQFDIAKENNAKTILNNIKSKTYKGVIFETSVGSPYPNYNENHGVSYKYEFITVSKEPFTNLYNEMKKVRDGLDSEISNALSGSITVVLPGYGVYGKYEAGLLKEELCQKYNLVCDRW